MLISEIGFESSTERLRVTALIAYEDTDRPAFSFFAETETALHPAFWPDPSAVLLAALLPAWRARERRIYVDRGLCPALAHDVIAALRVLRSWYPELGPPPIIEAGEFVARTPSRGPAVSLLSCGVDSLATLRQNKLLLPVGHPLAIEAAIPVIFAESPGKGVKGVDDGRLVPARNVASALGIKLAPIWTNLWWLVDDGYFYDQKWHGALLASLATLFSAGYSGAYIAASYDGEQLAYPWGSSPLLDPYYSSSYFRIQHHGASMSRLQKTSLISEWPAGLNNLRVCQKDGTGEFNCGNCEKCIRVMTALVALGRLECSAAFPYQDVSPELLSTVKTWDMIDTYYKLHWFTELIPRLSDAGRHDLVAVIQDFAEYFTKRL